MGHNSTLWRPDRDTRVQIEHGKRVFREKGSAAGGMTEKAAYERGRLAREEMQRRHSETMRQVADDERREADKRMGQPHHGH